MKKLTNIEMFTRKKSNRKTSSNRKFGCNNFGEKIVKVFSCYFFACFLFFLVNISIVETKKKLLNLQTSSIVKVTREVSRVTPHYNTRSYN